MSDSPAPPPPQPPPPPPFFPPAGQRPFPPPLSEMYSEPPVFAVGQGSGYPWYQQSWFVILTLIVFFPFGLWAMWTRKPGWRLRTNALVTGFVVLVLGLFALTSATTPPLHSTPVAARPASPTSSISTPTATSRPTQTPKPTLTPAPTPTPTPTPRPATPTPLPTATPVVQDLCGAPSNPWGYNFCSGGTVIDNPPHTFCDVFTPCIASFWTSTSGYVVQCVDGSYSHSGGRSGVCSDHGGEKRALFQ